MENQSQGMNKNLAMVCGTIIVVCVIISAVVLLGKGDSSNLTDTNGNTQNQQQTAQAVDISKVNLQGHPSVGDALAPVVVAFWSDYQCPYCKKTEQESLQQIYNDYVKTGKVRIVYKDYVFLGPDSVTAALASHAVWETAPDKFYAWDVAMFEKQDAENGGWGSKADILALTKSVGIDSVKVGQLMDSKAQEYQKAIDADKNEGVSFGIQGTPGTIIGKQFINGAQPYANFKAAIDLVLTGK